MKKVKDMTPEERREWMREIGRRGGRKGGLARAKQFTAASQRHARKHVSRAACAANGSKGAQRTLELHGYDALFEGARRKRLANPSKTELVMMGLLKTWGLQYEREYRLGKSFHTLDFYLPELNAGINVDGAIHDPGKPQFAKRQDWAKRTSALCAELGIRLVTLHHSELANSVHDMAPLLARILDAEKKAA